MKLINLVLVVVQMMMILTQYSRCKKTWLVTESLMLRFLSKAFSHSFAVVCCCCFFHSTVHLTEVGRKGLSSELAFHCTNERCKGEYPFSACQKIDLDVGNLKVNAINRRAALAMQCIGCDPEDLRTFCGIMNRLPPACKSSRSHQFINKTLEKATGKVMEESMSNAARLEYELAALVQSTPF